ncbi:ARM repeat-containing protein [Ascoidea rubescens DSM 1968]|uniref:ARM repeat-containing protein n=1 Tax=Ascoidea rubescens DSM 1968 TaxID=1344418 RepID=A0A1D2VMA7_9ASCO|nr:ARM repeat-containing protein [Ascoidea rubescens DSM 1968]ODV62697.1 ARM repeat-containing protein [Ascoidea rubescens DSM 1968]
MNHNFQSLFSIDDFGDDKLCNTSLEFTNDDNLNSANIKNNIKNSIKNIERDFEELQDFEGFQYNGYDNYHCDLFENNEYNLRSSIGETNLFRALSLNSGVGSNKNYNCNNHKFNNYMYDNYKFNRFDIQDNVKENNTNWGILIFRIIENNDHKASTFLQNFIKKSSDNSFSINDENSGIPDQLIGLITSNCIELMMSKYGNYLVQICFDYSSLNQINKICEVFTKDKNDILRLSMNLFGCHSLQKIITSLNVGLYYKKKIFEELLNRFNVTVRNKYSGHIWQKLLQSDFKLKLSVLVELNKKLEKNWIKIGKTESGSLIIQTVFENYSGDKSVEKQVLIDEIIDGYEELIVNKWGNWIINHLISFGEKEDQERLISKIFAKEKNLVQFSTNPYSSKVLLKIFQSHPNDMALAEKYINTICTRGSSSKVALIDGKITPFSASSASASRLLTVPVASNMHGSAIVQLLLGLQWAGVHNPLARAVHRHSVSIKSSKPGCRCAQLSAALAQRTAV